MYNFHDNTFDNTESERAGYFQKRFGGFTPLGEQIWVPMLGYRSVEILVFGVHENPLLLREVHMINKTILITFLDRRNSENS